MDISGYVLDGEESAETIHTYDFKDGEINIAGVWFVRKFWDRDKEIVHRNQLKKIK